MTGPIRQALGDIQAGAFIPAQLAEALDDHGPDAMAWVWMVDGKLLRLEVE